MILTTKDKVEITRDCFERLVRAWGGNYISLHVGDVDVMAIDDPDFEKQIAEIGDGGFMTAKLKVEDGLCSLTLMS